MYEVIIVGAGPAGITSSIYLARAGIKPLIIEREFYGGKMNYTNEISNYPGFSNISGTELSEKMFECTKSLDIDFEYANIVSSNLSGDVKILVSSNKKEYRAKCVIISTGLKTKSLKCKGEEEFKGKGVSYCATCDGFFFKNKDVAVVGNGNVSMEEAIYLSSICNRVYLIVNSNFINGDDRIIDSVKENKKIEVHLSTSVSEICGTDKVECLNLKSKNEEFSIKLDGVFIAIGSEPENGAFSEIKSNSFGYFESDELCRTNIEGVFVAGDCRNKFLRQIVTATSDGAIASSGVIKYLRTLSKKYVLSKSV